MPLSHRPAYLAPCCARLATALDPRSALRLPALLAGLLGTCGRRADALAVRLLPTVDPLRGGDRLRLVFDDTPTARWGSYVEGAGLHPNPNPGPAGERFVCGHVWVTRAALAKHPDRGTLALPLLEEIGPLLRTSLLAFLALVRHCLAPWSSLARREQGGNEATQGLADVGERLLGLLLARLQDRSRDHLGRRAGRGAVAAPDLAIHHRRPDRLLAEVVGRRHRRIDREQEPLRQVPASMPGQALVGGVGPRLPG